MREDDNSKMGILSVIGNTPMIKVEGIFAKLETHNATGSIKDRMVSYMVKRAEERGALKKGTRIIEVTSGNTGIAFALVSAIKGYRFTAIMPEHMSQERISMMRAFGAEIVLTPECEDMGGACFEYGQRAKRDPDAWLPMQFVNNDNVEAHRLGIGPEILRQMEGEGSIDAVVAGVGTGGTLIGIALAVREFFPNAYIVGVEPAESAVLNGGQGGLHKIEGIGEGFVPQIVEEHRYLINEVIAVPGEDAIKMSKRIAKEHGALVGISSGANLIAALELKCRFKNIVTVFPDRGERYLSKL